MKKTYLLKYEIPKFLVLKNWIDYELHLQTVWFWGLFKTEEISPYRVYDYQNNESHFKHWDKLISEKTPLK
tara:strand:- start:598 stop:810 length:213 start_codon:yes stop_codon:yes gene_type:complete